MTAPVMPTPIPLPGDFPVTWESPAESMLLWEREQLHMPYPMSPLAAEIVCEGVGKGITQALRTLGAPIVEARLKRVNTYIFQSVIPDLTLVEGAAERVKETVGRIGFTMYERWNNEFLPEIDAINGRIVGFDYRNATLAQLGEMVDQTLRDVDRALEIHFQLLPGFYMAPAFKEFCRAALGFEGLEAYEMMQGAPNLSVESGSKLWRLAQDAPQSVKDIITRNSSTDALARLPETADGRAFLGDFTAYLAEYGWRTGSFDFLTPSWVEHPEYAVDNLRLMLRVATDPAEDQRKGLEKADAMANECRAKLAANPELAGQFEFLLAKVREYPQLQENHNFHIDQKLLACSRLPFLEVGRRMVAAGVMEDAEDFPYLSLADIHAFLSGSTESLKGVVEAAKGELEHWSKVIPPGAIGAMPPAMMEDPFRVDFFGRPTIERSADPRVLKGTPSSRGRARGRARVIKSLAEADRIEEGDILVCEMTTPAWTPLFASLAGIVSDSGGPLSHCAVVAREYGVPCVTGTRIATVTIPDGVMVTLDGTEGTVTIEGQAFEG